MDDITWIRESLKRIEGRLEDGSEKCRVRHSALDKELAALTVRAGFYGALAGAVPALIMVVAWLFKY